MGNQFIRIDQALTDLEACSGEVTVHQDLVAANIESAVRELQIALEARKTELLNQLQEISRGKLKSLAAQKDQLETTQAQLHSCEGFVRQSIKTECQSEVLKMRKTIIHQAKELMTEFPPSFLKPCTEPDVMFSASGNTTFDLQQYGNVSTATYTVNPDNCQATGKGLVTAVSGEWSRVTVQAVSWNGCQCMELIESLECELESMLTGARVRGGVKEVGRGQYEISYQPVTKGRNLLHVRVGGLNIRGSPFDVKVVSAVEHPGVPIQTLSCIGNPFGVALNSMGEVIISLQRANRISIFSPAGIQLRSFGTRGSGPGQFLDPRGVAVDDEGNILVADSSNYRIQKFTDKGKFLASVTLPLSPKGIAVNPLNKKVYVLDSNNNRIHVLNPDLTFSSIIGKPGSGAGQFHYPCGITCDAKGQVYVADSKNNRIQVFTASGEVLREFTCRDATGQLVWPADIAVGDSGMVFVSSRDSHCISVFTSEGQFVTSFGQLGERPGDFVSPTGVAMDVYGVLYVCDSENNRVQMF